MKNIKNFKKNRGFTLLELVIVIAIIAILITIAAVKYSSASISAQAVSHNANVRIIKNAAILYLSDNPEKASSISMDEISKYLEDSKKIKPAKALKLEDNQFKVEYNQTSDKIIVTPGLVEVVDNKLKLVENNGTN